MFKYIVLLIAIGAFSTGLSAQGNGVVVRGKWADQVSITDVNGRPFANKYADVAGTPFFQTDFKLANLTLKQGRTFVNVRMKINLLTQETNFISSNNIEGYIEAGQVREVVYTDTTATGIIPYKFQTGFPAIDKQTANNYYQVLSEGRIMLLKSIVKSINERKNELSGEIAKDFESREEFYLFAGGMMKRIKKDKDFFLSEMADKKEAVSQFIQTNKLGFKNIDHISKLVNYYNSL